MIRLSHQRPRDPMVFSTYMMIETCSVKRSPGLRTIRDLMITSGRVFFQRLHRTFRRLRQNRETANEQESQFEEETMESDLMDAAGSLHQKSNEVCITEDAESIDPGLFESTKFKRVKNGTRFLLQVGVRDWESLGTSPSRTQKGFGETVAEVMDAEVEGDDEIHHSRRPRVAERVAIHVPPGVEAQNLDFDVNEFLRSSPNPVVASVFGD